MDGWARLGKPDFSQCAKLFYRLPAELREGLNRSEEKVLIWSLFLTWYRTFHGGRGDALASFSESWVGKRFGRSRYTVIRALGKLEALHLVKRIRRPPDKNGTFRTNLIALTARLTTLFGVNCTQPRDKSPCSTFAPQQVKNLYKSETTPPFGSSLTQNREEDGKCLEKARLLFAQWSKKLAPSPASA